MHPFGYDSINYIKPKDYEFFLDTCVTYTTNEDIIKYDNNIQSNNLIKNNKLMKNKIIERNYIYRNYDLNQIKKSLDNIELNNYTLWLSVSFAIKDLWLGINSKEDKQLLYEIYDNVCKKSNNYNENNNYNIFSNLNPIIDINYLFSLTETKYFIHPFYNYQKIIFNLDKYKNVFKDDKQFINIDIDEFIKHNIIYIKSPTGTGKTTILKEIIKKINIQNIISITSRVNLAGEHVNSLNLSFYKDLDATDYKYCDRLVIQLESIWKCKYKNFQNGIVILDEVNSLLSHLRSPTFTNKRSDCYNYLIEIIKNAKYVICLDADLSDWNISFIDQIRKDKYIVYQNICKNKINIPAEFFYCDQTMIDIMAQKLTNNNYFIACFDSLTKMKGIIDYLSKFGKKEDWLIYSSEVEYNLIDTKTWRNKFIFFSPTILYGIDYNEAPVDVFCFVHKFHLNPLQVYQMISRARQITKVYVYCHQKLFYLKYKSVDDVIHEFNLFEKNFSMLVNNYESYCKIDEAPYKTMYFNYKYMDSVLKTNIKEYLMDMMLNVGYIITENKIINGKKINSIITKENIKEKIVDLLHLDKENLTDFERELVSNDKKLEKHLNLRIFLNKNYEEKLTESITSNLFTETIKNKITKIKICSELMKVLGIKTFENFDKDLTKNFGNEVTSVWLEENMETIKKVFDIRGKKYNNTNYYTIYQLLTTILKNLFDNDLFIVKRIQISNICFYYYDYNSFTMINHQKIFNIISDNLIFND